MVQAARIVLTLVLVSGVACGSKGQESSEPSSPVTPSTVSPTTATPPGPASTSGCTETKAVDLTGDDPFTLVIQDFKFKPDCFIVSVSASVAIRNKDNVANTFTIDGTLVQAPLRPGKTYRHGPSTGFLDPGVAYPFHCSIHPQITGTMIVV